MRESGGRPPAWSQLMTQLKQSASHLAERSRAATASYSPAATQQVLRCRSAESLNCNQYRRTFIWIFWSQLYFYDLHFQCTRRNLRILKIQILTTFIIHWNIFNIFKFQDVQGGRVHGAHQANILWQRAKTQHTTQSQTRLKQTTKMFQIKASCSPLNIKLNIFVVKYFQLCANCQHSAEVGPVGITPPPTTLSPVSRCHYFRFHYLCTSPEMSCAENISYC